MPQRKGSGVGVLSLEIRVQSVGPQTLNPFVSRLSKTSEIGDWGQRWGNRSVKVGTVCPFGPGLKEDINKNNWGLGSRKPQSPKRWGLEWGPGSAQDHIARAANMLKSLNPRRASNL